MRCLYCFASGWHHTEGACGRPRSGFALIIALMLMGMLVLMLVSLQTLTQVEIRTHEQVSQQAQAENNARLALMLAIGRLQEAAGPDRRATATLEVMEGRDGVGYDPLMRFWAGVWKNAGDYSEGTNLMEYDPELVSILVSGADVSGSESGGLELPSGDYVQIVGSGAAGSNAGVVSVPKVLLGNGSDGAGHYAYWVGDEGVKANVVIRDRSAQVADPSGGAATQQRREALRLAAAPHYGVDLMAGLGDFPINSEILDSVVMPAQLGSLAAGIASPMKERFHDATVYSYGLLVDQRRGGLRRDLSYLLNQGEMEGRLWPDGPGFERLRSYATYALDKTAVQPRVGTGAPVDVPGIYPVITQFYVYFNVVPVQVDATRWGFALEIYPVVVLHNPYNVDLASAPMRIQIDLPEAMVNLSYQNAQGASVVGDFPLVDALGSNRRLTFDIPDLSIPAGMAVMLSVSGSDVAYSASGHQMTQVSTASPGFITLPLVEANDNEPTGAVSNIFWRLVLEDEPSNSRRMLVLYTRNRNAQIYQEFKQYPLLAQKPGVDENDKVPLVAAEESGTPAGGFGYSMAVLSSEQPLPVYGSFNPRARYAEQRLFSGGIRMGVDAVMLPQVSEGHPFVGSVFGADMGLSGSHEIEPEVTKAILFDANRYGLISLGQLQHLDLSHYSATNKATTTQAPAHIFGNSFANPYVARSSTRNGSYMDFSYHSNEALWDGYYFSTIPQTQTGMMPEVLANSRLGRIPPAVDEISNYLGEYAPAELLWIDGAFNINSTSVEAWIALLSALRQGGDGGLMPRFVEYFGAIDMTQERAPSGLSAEAWNSVRKLTDEQIVALADSIVGEVKARGPFLSLAQFVNRELDSGASGLSGAIQSALEQTDINQSMRAAAPRVPVGDAVSSPGVVSVDNYASYREGEDYYLDFLRGASGLLTQADILTLIGPVIAARSDTFLVRAYGDVVDPADSSRVLAQAWCEAVVQRYPDRMDADYRSIAEDADDGGGRRFRIINFRWLSAGDI